MGAMLNPEPLKTLIPYRAAPVLCAWGTGEARPSRTLCPVLRARGGGDARAPGLCGTLDAPLSECSDAQLPKRLQPWQGPGLWLSTPDAMPGISCVAALLDSTAACWLVTKREMDTAGFVILPSLAARVPPGDARLPGRLQQAGQPTCEAVAAVVAVRAAAAGAAAAAAALRAARTLRRTMP